MPSIFLPSTTMWCAEAADLTAPFTLEPAWLGARRHDKGEAKRPTAGLSPGYLLVLASAFSNIGCALQVPHSGGLSQIVSKSWLE